jgi:hypothetical protein
MSNPLTEPVARFGVRAPKIQHTTNLVFKPVTEIVSPVRTTHGIVYKNVDLKTPRDVYKFLMDRS